MKKRVMVMIGGVSRESLNHRFFKAVAALDEGRFEFEVADIASLPHYSQDAEANPPASVVALKRLAAESDAVLIVTPEYNRSIPGVLKNALDWGSRPVGAPDPHAHGNGGVAGNGNSWAGKPAAILGATPGAIGTFGAQQHLRNILSWLDAAVMNQPAIYFNASIGMANTAGEPSAAGNRLTERSAEMMRSFLAAFEVWIGRFTASGPR